MATKRDEIEAFARGHGVGSLNDVNIAAGIAALDAHRAAQVGGDEVEAICIEIDVQDYDFVANVIAALDAHRSIHDKAKDARIAELESERDKSREANAYMLKHVAQYGARIAELDGALQRVACFDDADCMLTLQQLRDIARASLYGSKEQQK